jgi:hypothetical protein
MFSRYIIKIFAAVGLVIFCLGCVQKSTQLEDNWGKSLETAKYRQMLNPDADKNLAPAVELDGKAAESVVEKYRGTFKEKSRQENVNILRMQ